MKYLLTLPAIFLLLFSQNSTANTFNLNDQNSKQFVMVIAEDEDDNFGQLYAFEKINNMWQKQDLQTKVMLGKNGIAWGLGLHDKQNAVYKKEGDGRAPAGIFKLGSAFGYLDSVNTQLDYSPMTANDYCIDVNGSPFYNQLVNRAVVGDEAIKGSTEPMRRDIHKNNDPVYRKGIWVHHNDANISAGGSCIFVHIWRKDGAPTAGCTAMPEETLDKLLAWLDKRKEPLMATLSKTQYQAVQQKWQLPLIN